MWSFDVDITSIVNKNLGCFRDKRDEERKGEGYTGRGAVHRRELDEFLYDTITQRKFRIWSENQKIYQVVMFWINMLLTKDKKILI